MAFWALYKKPWFKRDIPNFIELFKQTLYDEWYNSLPPEEQKRIIAQKSLEKHRVKQAMTNLLTISSTISALGGYYAG